MNEEFFINKHKEKWDTLQTLTKQIEKKGVKKLSYVELKEFINLFRATSHHLAYARTHFPDSSIVTFLNSLLGRAHNHIYSVKKSSSKEIIQYFKKGFASNVNLYKSYIFIAFCIFLFGSILSFTMVMINPDFACYFLPESILQNIEFDDLGPTTWNYPLMSSVIMVNNISVSLKALVYGITFGIGTIYVLLFNGFILGSLAGLVYQNGSMYDFLSLILPHGIIELFAIFIAGGAGLIIAHAMLIPKELTRKHALISGAKKAISLVFGICLLLVIAGLIEGFFTPLHISATIKLIFAFITFVLLVLYFYRPYNKSSL